MQLWSQWWSWVEPLRSACSRSRTFLWLATAIAGMSSRADLLGVSSIIRALGFCERFYDRLLDFFHSNAIDPDVLTRCWVQLVFQRMSGICRSHGRPVLLGDGIKTCKRGRRMPAVKLLHQTSESNTKPSYIMGHSIQVVSVLVSAASTFFAVPLSARIHEGLLFSTRDQRTLSQKFLSLVGSLGLQERVYLVADSYFACQTIALGLLAQGSDLISRLRKNSVAFEAIPPHQIKKPKPGRPKFYGPKIRLFSLFDSQDDRWLEVVSPVYGEQGVIIRYLSLDLIWRPIQRLARFVLVDHPHRGRILLLCTDYSLHPNEIIRLYGLRFKIELSFKQAVRSIGVYAYHFWMSIMDKIPFHGSDQYLHRKSTSYRNAARRKLAAYHRHIQIGLIAQGILQCLAATAPSLVWANFGSWFCTIRSGIPPSELIVMLALRNTLPEFLARSSPAASFTKFIRDRIDLNRFEGLRLAG